MHSTPVNVSLGATILLMVTLSDCHCRVFKKSKYLDGCGSEREYLVPGALGVAVHVDEDVDAVGVDLVGRLVVGRRPREVDKVLRLARDLLPEGGAVVGLQAVAEDLDAAAVVHAGDGLHEVRGGVVAKVGAHVADLEALARLESPGVLEWRLVEDADLL